MEQTLKLRNFELLKEGIKSPVFSSMDLGERNMEKIKQEHYRSLTKHYHNKQFSFFGHGTCFLLKVPMADIYRFFCNHKKSQSFFKMSIRVLNLIELAKILGLFLLSALNFSSFKYALISVPIISFFFSIDNKLKKIRIIFNILNFDIPKDLKIFSKEIYSKLSRIIMFPSKSLISRRFLRISFFSYCLKLYLHFLNYIPLKMKMIFLQMFSKSLSFY